VLLAEIEEGVMAADNEGSGHAGQCPLLPTAGPPARRRAVGVGEDRYAGDEKSQAGEL